MSCCEGRGSRYFRLTGEFYNKESITFGSGDFGIQLRCAESGHGCFGGKVAIIGSDLLRILGIDIPEEMDDLICSFAENSPIVIEIDLI